MSISKRSLDSKGVLIVKIRRIATFIVIMSVFLISTSFVNNVESTVIDSTTPDIINNDSEVIVVDYEVPTLPDETIPEWEFNITGIGLNEPVTLNLTYIIDQINTSKLDAYEEIVEYKDVNQTIIGFDILQCIQEYADVWYAGELTFKAQDGYSKSLNTSDILYSYHPPAIENADIKILLAFVVNGSYLENTDWADKGSLRLVCPSNQKVDYWSSMWVGNITEIEVTEKWKCDVFVDGELETSVEVGAPSEFPNYNYISYNLTYKDENVEFEGPSLLSIFEDLGVDFDDIATFQAQAPDSIATINKTELTGEKPAILAMAGNGEYFGFDRGPYRLIGGNLNGWNWLKNCYAIYVTTGASSQTPTGTIPGFSSCVAILALLAIPISICLVSIFYIS